MINIANKEDCCGCTACASICTHQAITMEPDTLGFLYPKVNLEKCTNCGLCEKVCAFNDNYDKSLNLEKPESYGARHKNINEVETSRSGAAFIAFSDWILEQNGVVYGVGYKDHLCVVHKRATTKKERNEFKGSKYVQSDLRGIFQQVKQDLKNNKIVLFTGTPCQTSGLNSYIGRKYRKNLFLIDIVCHGVPSPSIWKDYISYYEKKYKKTILSVNFRDKKYGWDSHKETFILEDRIKVSPKYHPWSTLFCEKIMYRKSCGICHFCNIIRPSDITIADFWGWEKTMTKINLDNMGISLLLINTAKGKELFQNTKSELTTFRARLEDCLQPNLKFPTILNTQSSNFENQYQKYGFEYIIKKYTNVGIKKRSRLYWHQIKYRLKSIFK